MRLSFSCLASLVVLTGCALHAPMSETFLFHEPYPTRPAHTADVTLGLTATQSYAPVSSIGRHFVRADSIESANGHKRAGGVYLAFYEKEVALSLTAGPLLFGGDLTGHLWGRNYFSALLSGGGWRLTVLHRTLNTPFAGAALGLAVQRERYYYFYPGGESIVPSFNTPFVYSAGVRAFGILRTAPTDNGVLHGGLYLGYAPSVRRPVLQLTLSFGNF
ncbi:hypothetical protein [Rhodocaloribacter sp.]